MANLSFKNFFKEEKVRKKDKIRNLLDGRDLILFFKKGDKYFGAPEESRIIFAKMKNPDDDEEMPTGWADDANFSALDLMHALDGGNSENLFSLKDMPNINVMDRDAMEKELLRCPCNQKALNPTQRDDIGLITLKDKE
jgi:hypothetical protein